MERHPEGPTKIKHVVVVFWGEFFPLIKIKQNRLLMFFSFVLLKGSFKPNPLVSKDGNIHFQDLFSQHPNILIVESYTTNKIRTSDLLDYVP